MKRLAIKTEPLTRVAFAPFGDVIDKQGVRSFPTNRGTSVRYHDLARMQVTAEEGRGLISIFEVAKPAVLPVKLWLMERHPLSSQAFVPLSVIPLVVVVAPGREPPTPESIRAFLSDGRQGINFHPATWHHPMLALAPGDFLVVDRTGPGEGFDQDYEEVLLDAVDVTVTLA